jgi:hypothetical protein
VPLSPELVTVLKAWKLACPLGTLGADRLVFPDGKGRINSHTALSRDFQR